MLNGYTARLTALYTTLFAISVAILGAVTLFATRAELQTEFDHRIQVESEGMVREYQTEGLDGIIEAVQERDMMPGALDYGFDGPNVRVGRLSGSTVKPGWSVLRMTAKPHHEDADRVFTAALPGGYRIEVGDDLDRTAELDGAIIRGFTLAFIGILVLGAAGGYGLSRGIRRRLAAFTGTAEAIIDGDLSRRVPVAGVKDDLEGLALTLNRMLDRISALMENVRQVSNDLAHDLRTPLTRLRNKLESGLEQHGANRTALIESALVDVDAILTTFGAMLRIAQIDASARRAGFQPIDLAAIARNVVDAFAPSAEEGGRILRLEGDATGLIDGDVELLTQMLVNLVENSLHHTPVGSTIAVTVKGGAAPALSVTDNGQGVPLAERDRVLEPFYRLEQSRSTPGAGLGLALAAAIARLHHTTLRLGDAGPGLRVDIAFVRRA